jgi:hypothetical protein
MQITFTQFMWALLMTTLQVVVPLSIGTFFAVYFALRVWTRHERRYQGDRGDRGIGPDPRKPERRREASEDDRRRDFARSLATD